MFLHPTKVPFISPDLFTNFNNDKKILTENIHDNDLLTKVTHSFRPITAQDERSVRKFYNLFTEDFHSQKLVIFL